METEEGRAATLSKSSPVIDKSFSSPISASNYSPSIKKLCVVVAEERVTNCRTLPPIIMSDLLFVSLGIKGWPVAGRISFQVFDL